ncbi:unnamed protein product [Mytilus coruscus]|uniref:NCAM n=1 Tax=Mytilus coruscus TaxID=42192 RepID=A0A6J8C5D3_MYTCO|nr:unnamed protein product [Mytilus coruscus]
MPNVTSVPIMPWFEGNDTQLKCTFENGNPDATIVWKKEKDDLQSNDNRHVFDFHNLNRKDNGSTVTCSVYNKYSNQSKSVDIIVEYYPRVVVQHTYVNTSEGKNISINCNASGNPVPIVKWIRNKSQLTGSNTGHSILNINNIDRNNESTYTCTANSISGTYGNLTTKENVSVVVNFAPDVTVNRNLSDIEEGKYLKLQCIAKGKPSYFVYGWRHMFRDIVIRNFESNSRTLLLENLSYQDFGHYECIVNNGIKDRQGRLNQTNGTEIEVKYRPVFIHFNKVITAKVGENVTTAVEFITFPDTNEEVQWKNSTDNSIVVNSSNLFTTLHRQTVDTTIYGKNVSINTFSYRSALVLPKFEIDQAGFYILQVNNTVGGNNITLRVVVSDRPKPPTQFVASVIGSTTVTLTWTGGFNGGNQQTFIITYWEINSSDKRSQNVTEISEQIAYEEIIQDLLPSTTYVFVINSANVEGISDGGNNTVIYKTEGISKTASSILGPVGGSVGGTIFVILIIMVVIFILRKQSDGLKINELYVSAGDDLDPCAGPGDVYAVVDKSNGKKSYSKQHIQETGLYAEVNKRKDAPIKATIDSNAEIQKKLKINRKGKTKIEKKKNDDVYENIGEENHRQIASTNKNKDGLVYADLVFNDDGKRKFVIRGIENKTDYADVDLSIKVDPLPSDESDKEDEQETNNSGGVQKPQ